MGEIGKIVRWVAPGAVFSLLSLITVLITRTIWGLGRFAVSLLNFSGEVTAGIVALAIPVGFLIYQEYYRGYLRAGPLSVFLPYVRSMPPQAVLQAAMPAEWKSEEWETKLSGELLAQHCPVFTIPFIRRLALVDGNRNTVKGKERRKRTREYQLRRRLALTRLDHALTSAYGERGAGLDIVRARVERLAEIYHTLGASRRACFWAWLGGLGWAVATRLQWTDNGFDGADVSRSFLALVASGGACAYVASIVHMNRSDTKERLDAIYPIVLPPIST